MRQFLLGGLCGGALTIGIFLWKTNKPVAILCFVVAALVGIVAGVLPT